MKRQRLLSITLLVFAMLLAGCRREAASGQQAAATATITPTPYSTALPAVPTLVPPGSETRALQMVVYSTNRSATSAATRIETALSEQGLNVQILIRERPAEVLAALCDSGSGQVAVAWLDGITYAAARAESCGTPVLLVERDDAIGSAVDIVINQSLGTDNIFSLRDQPYCRINYDDFNSWIAPSLVFRADGLNPVSAFESITDYEDTAALLEAVAAGDCSITSVAAGTLDDTDFADILDDLSIIETSVAFPYNILMIPIEVPLDIRIQLIDALETIAADSTLSGSVGSLLGDDAVLVPMESDTLDEFHNFIDNTGLNFALLGS